MQHLNSMLPDMEYLWLSPLLMRLKWITRKTRKCLNAMKCAQKTEASQQSVLMTVHCQSEKTGIINILETTPVGMTTETAVGVITETTFRTFSIAIGMTNAIGPNRDVTQEDFYYLDQNVIRYRIILQRL